MDGGEMCGGETAQGKGQQRHFALVKTPKRTKAAAVFVVLLLLHIATVGAPMAVQNYQQQQQRKLAQMPMPTTDESIQTVDEANRDFVQSLRIKALQNLQRSLESLSSLTANSLMLNAALQPSAEETPNDDQILEEEDKETAEEEQRWEDAQAQNSFSTTTIGHPMASNGGAKRNGILRIKADLKEMSNFPAISDDFGTISPIPTTVTSVENEHAERSRLTRARHLRSAGGRHHHHQQQHHNYRHRGHEHGTTQQHRRRRKGCPTVQGKDQLLCPTRSSQRYDVCITRDQLCDRQRDCPGGEDEDPRHCFFFRPLEHSLKTISHAVLLLVDTVMRDQEEQQQRQRNEL